MIWKRRFRTLALYEKRGYECRKRTCHSVPQWGESDGRSWPRHKWCDEHAMERMRKVFGLRDVTIEQPDKVVTGAAS